MDKKQTYKNAVTSIIQVLVASSSLFILYRLLLKTLGIELIGVWSLVLATTSLTRFANLGFTGSIVKYIAKYKALGEIEAVSLIIQTSTISVGAFLGVISILAYPVAKLYIGFVVHPDYLPDALSILPYAFLAFWLTMVNMIFQSGLYGFQLVHLRNFVLMGDSTLYLLLSYLLAPRYGLMGLAYARVFQNCVTLAINWILLKINISNLPTIPIQWSKKYFNETIRYAVNFQVISVVAMVYDPMTKGFLSHFGSVSLVGYYEIANKVIQQVRALLVSANQVLVPEFAALKETKPEKILSLYKSSNEVILFILFPTFSILMVSAPSISIILIGRYSNEFVLFTTLLVIGWFFNVLSVPAYFANLGVGHLRWNVISHIIIGLLNLIFGYTLGNMFGGTGVVVGWVIALMIGSSIISISFHLNRKIPLQNLIPKAHLLLASTCFLGIIISYIIYECIDIEPINKSAYFLVIVAFTIFIFIPIWQNPMRKKIMSLFPMLLGKNT